MIEFNVEEFAFVLQEADLVEDDGHSRVRLKHHPEPARSPIFNSSGGLGSSDHGGWNKGLRRAQAREKRTPAGQSGSAATSAQRFSYTAAERPGQAAPGRRPAAAARGKPVPANGGVEWQGSRLPLRQGIGEQEQGSSDAQPTRWHASTLSAGSVSDDGHVFTKACAGPRKKVNDAVLSSLCILFEAALRVGGVHRYSYTILEGSVGNADGVGFIFDTKVRRTNIQRVHSIFLNRHGQICMRSCENIHKTPHFLPRLALRTQVCLTIDLDHALARFEMRDADGKRSETKNISFEQLLCEADHRDANFAARGPTSGFFCAIVTDNIKVSLY